MSITLIIGGARSGKSSFAERLAKERTDAPVYLATSRIWDEDHHKRIKRHQADRGPEWTTIEEEKSLSGIGLEQRVIVVDCVTLWLTNFFLDLKQDPDATLNAVKEEFDRAMTLKNDWIFVTNELGQGLHAETESGRKFTDVQGFLNQYIARRASRVTLMVAGIPLDVKNEAASAS